MVSNTTLEISLPVRSSTPLAPIVVRSMRRADVPALVRLWFASYPSRLTSGANEVDEAAEWTAAFDGQYGAFLDQASFVVESAGKLVAATQVVRDAPWDRTPTGPFILEVIVDPDVRRRGIARTLLINTLHQLTVLGYQTASLRVETDNVPALALYQQLGFREWQPKGPSAS
jgi:N-alpha-acetyltransferase 10/11